MSITVSYIVQIGSKMLKIKNKIEGNKYNPLDK